MEGDGGRRASRSLPSTAGRRLEEEPVGRDREASATRGRTQRQKGEDEEPKAHTHGFGLFGFVWVGLRWDGLGWVGMVWVGLGWIGLGWVGLRLGWGAGALVGLGHSLGHCRYNSGSNEGRRQVS